MNNTLRITSGMFRGRRIATPGGKTHPMGERERLALFNMINDCASDALAMDAYAGSGALGIEALSRGAKKVVFIDKSRDAAECIKKNLLSLGFYRTTDGRYQLKTDDQRFNTNDTLQSPLLDQIAEVHHGAAERQSFVTKFDLIIADPPYDLFRLSDIESLSAHLRLGGVFVLSHPGHIPVITGLSIKSSRRYAGATISIFVKE